jgi:hypothetical protein
MNTYYIPNEDPLFETLKNTTIDDTCLGAIVGSGWGGSVSGPNHPWSGQKHSEETKKKMSASRRGEDNSNYGNTWSEESRVRLSEYVKNRPLEHTEKLAAAHRGKPTSTNQKKAVAEANKKRWAAYRASKSQQSI